MRGKKNPFPCNTIAWETELSGDRQLRLKDGANDDPRCDRHRGGKGKKKTRKTKIKKKPQM